MANAQWVRNPIDAFLARQHEEFGLPPQPEASRIVLLRRLQIDLIGLPPMLAEIAALENDTSPDWYQRAVDRLLDDPRHGERWARHWMDIWRYSDWWGFNEELRNSQKHIWHWRDWIVESLNADTPYDEMVRQMLAADELYPNDLEKLRATGFLARNWFLFNRHQWMDDVVEHVGKGFLGITLNCAKCHDHKFDPLAQVEYYKMRAFFEPCQVRMDMVPHEADLARDGIPRAFDGPLDAPTYRKIRGDEKNPDTSTVIAPGVPSLLAFKPLDIQPVSLPNEAWQPERRPWVLDAYLAAARKTIESTNTAVTSAHEHLAAALKHQTEASAGPPELIDQAKAAVGIARSKLSVAELSAAVAQAELVSLEHRAVAMRAAWARSDANPNNSGDPPSDDERVKIKVAVQSERDVALAKANHALAVVELRLASAPADQREAIEAELKTAREAQEKAAQAVATTIGEQ